ncbi:MAG: class I SAM-dependent methyltransferase [Magnetococcales bacterium]|nr:class I SAM-dependent methyltransferase [Magnetococcales bacterium]
MRPVSATKAYIPQRQSIVTTSDVDGADSPFGYWGYFSYPMRRRLDMVVEAMKKKSGYHRILDAGYGCGVFLPDLYHRLDPNNGVLHGVDIHDSSAEVKQNLTLYEEMDDQRIELGKYPLFALPFPDHTFDLIVSVSVLEHIPPHFLPSCLDEIKRVAAPGAEIILGFPTDCILIRALAWIQKQNLRENHPSTHEDITHAIHQAGLRIECQTRFPWFAGPLTMHYNVRCTV